MKKSKAGKFILWAFVFAFCNMVWVFFRAPNLQEAHYILTHFTVGILSPASFLRNGFEAMGIVEIRTFRMMIALAVLLIGDLGVYRGCLTSKWERLPCAVRWIGYLVFIWLIWMLIPLESSGLFIYFQF